LPQKKKKCRNEPNRSLHAIVYNKWSYDSVEERLGAQNEAAGGVRAVGEWVSHEPQTPPLGLFRMAAGRYAAKGLPGRGIAPIMGTKAGQGGWLCFARLRLPAATGD
jgi:hypothetical protein